jgi:alpha-methylacyl-CoA racemase
VAAFLTRTRDAWTSSFQGTDACVSPVLGLTEAPDHPHLRARGTFIEHNGITQPGPAPRFSRSKAAVTRPPCLPGQHTDEVLAEWGVASPANSA